MEYSSQGIYPAVVKDNSSMTSLCYKPILGRATTALKGVFIERKSAYEIVMERRRILFEGIREVAVIRKPDVESQPCQIPSAVG
jgi:hypothetical protein